MESVIVLNYVFCMFLGIMFLCSLPGCIAAYKSGVKTPTNKESVVWCIALGFVGVVLGFANVWALAKVA